MIIYIEWEGRTYQPESWEADKMRVKHAFSRPIEVAAYDVGLLVREVGKEGFIRSTRHGVMGDPWTPADTQAVMDEVDDGWDGPYANLTEAMKAHPEWLGEGFEP